MLRILLFRFWPVLIPIAGYILYKIIVRRRKQKQNKNIIDVTPEEVMYQQKLFMWIVVSSFIIAILCFILTFYLSVQESGDVYTPARLENGEIVPPKLERE